MNKTSRWLSLNNFLAITVGRVNATECIHRSMTCRPIVMRKLSSIFELFLATLKMARIEIDKSWHSVWLAENENKQPQPASGEYLDQGHTILDGIQCFVYVLAIRPSVTPLIANSSSFRPSQLPPRSKHSTGRSDLVFVLLVFSLLFLFVLVVPSTFLVVVLDCLFQKRFINKTFRKSKL